MGALSFNGNKIITSGGGGALITDSKKNCFICKKIGQCSKKNHPWKMSFTEKGYNYRMPNINAALGYSQIQKITKMLKYKKLIYINYKKSFKKNKYFYIYKSLKNSSPNHWLITIILKKEVLTF